jgi:hypothetical protein
MRRLFYIASVALVALSGCQKFLDTPPDNRTVIDDLDKVEKLLTNAYPRITSAMFLEARCDGMASFGSLFQGGQQSTPFESMRTGFYWAPYVEGDADDTYERYWEDQYRAISYCNFALKALDENEAGWDDQRVRQARSEALVCRAYLHFNLLTLFSDMFNPNLKGSLPGIPYVEGIEDDVYQQYKRGTINSTLMLIKRDLEAGLKGIAGRQAYAVPQFRFSRESAIAFAVRFFLYTGDYNQVIAYANMLLPTATTFDTETGLDYDNGTVRYVSPQDAAFIKMRSTLLDWQAYRATGTDLYKPGMYFSDPKNTSYLLMSEVGSVAWRAFLGTLQTSYAYPQETMKEIAGVNVTGGVWALPILQLSGDQAAFIIKYYEDFLLVDEAAGIGYVYLKENLFRLEEVLLARAEAKALLGDFRGAVDDLNLYLPNKVNNYFNATSGEMNKAYRLSTQSIFNYYTKSTTLPNYPGDPINEDMFAAVNSDYRVFANALIACIMDVRRAEFIYEGMRYVDILRWHIPITHTRMTDGVSHTLDGDDDNRILQLPEATAVAGLEKNRMSNITDPWPGIAYNY